MSGAMDGSSTLVARELDRSRYASVWALMDEGVSQGVAPGMVAGLWDARDPGAIQVAAVGSRRAFPRSRAPLPMTPETSFDLASLTKVMATAPLAATLVDRGWIGWDTPLSSVLARAAWGAAWPDAGAARGGEPIRIRHLLSHTAGFAAWAPLWERMRERLGGKPLHRFSVRRRQLAMREFVLAIPPDVAPGKQAVYSDISFLLLGFALEEVTGLPLDQAVKRLVWAPMGLETAHYHPVVRDSQSDLREECAATEESPWRGGLLQGQVHDDNCWSMGGYAGHAGAFGTVRDVLQFARALYPSWAAKAPGPGGFLSHATLRAAWTRVAEPAGTTRTLGWDSPSAEDSSSGKLFSPGSVGHLGFTGTSLWIDPLAGIAVTLLTNRVHPTRENTLIRAFRPKFHDALRGARRD